MKTTTIISAFTVIASLTACGSTDTVDGLSRVVDPPPTVSSKVPDTESKVLMMRGHFTYMADAALFADCATGQRLHVAMEADYIGLERAYLDSVSEAGQPLLVSIEASIVERPAMEGDDVEEVVLVNRFDSILQDESCAPEKPDAALRNTHWALTRIRTTRVYVGAGKREPFIMFESTTNNIRGYTGCNQLMGSYQMEGSQLTFGTLSTTKMYCADTMKVEDTFLVALRSVTAFEVSGDTLTLLDSKGREILFEARYFE